MKMESGELTQVEQDKIEKSSEKPFHREKNWSPRRAYSKKVTSLLPFALLPVLALQTQVILKEEVTFMFT